MDSIAQPFRMCNRGWRKKWPVGIDNRLAMGYNRAMSEYQYYEWQTIDRPLTDEEQAAVNRLSSHIDVTSTRAEVTYSWGDFKHDPQEVLARYFDAFLYLANWGSRQLMFRFPKGLVDVRQVAPYCLGDYITFGESGEYAILDIQLNEEGGGDWVEGEGWLSSLARLRDDILQGDYRALYLAWLGAVTLEDVDDEEREPPVPPGLADLSAPLSTCARFFRVDDHLLQVAAQASGDRQAVPEALLRQAIAQLPPEERDAFLLRLLAGEPQLAVALKRRLEEVVGRPQIVGESRRTAGQLLAARDRERKRERARQSQAAATKRRQELDALAQREPQAWQEVGALIQTYQPKSYDQAVELLANLRDLSVYKGTQAAFQDRLSQIRVQYQRKTGLMNRLRQKGLIP